MSIGASQLTGERMPLFSRALIPQSSGIFEGAVVSYCAVTGDDHGVDLPNAATVLLGGRAYAGISAAHGPTVLPQDNSITVQKAGIAKCQLLANTACTAGAECCYDPADAGYVKQLTPANAGVVVVIGRFTQSKASNASAQMVGVELYAHGSAGGERLLGAIVATVGPVGNSTTETAYAVSIPIPAGRIQTVGTVLKIRAKARATSTHSTDTLKLTCRLDTAADVSVYKAGGVLQRFAKDFLQGAVA